MLFTFFNSPPNMRCILFFPALETPQGNIKKEEKEEASVSTFHWLTMGAVIMVEELS